MEEFEIKDFADLHKILSTNYHPNGKWIFRGQSNITWPLLPKVGRKEFDSYDFVFDKLLFENWCNNAVAYMELPKNLWERYAIAQHYGLATRLLDWSNNPLVSVFFAVSENSDIDSCVYCLNIKPSSTVIDPNIDIIFSHDSFGFYSPSSYITRIIGQSSVFTFHPNPKQSLDNIPDEITIEKIIIPKESKANLLFDINYYGINNKVLFPDLDGLSKHLNWFYGNDNWRKDRFKYKYYN